MIEVVAHQLFRDDFQNALQRSGGSGCPDVGTDAGAERGPAGARTAGPEALRPSGRAFRSVITCIEAEYYAVKQNGRSGGTPPVSSARPGPAAHSDLEGGGDDAPAMPTRRARGRQADAGQLRRHGADSLISEVDALSPEGEREGE